MFSEYLDVGLQDQNQVVHVLPVPYEATVTFAPGTSQGPEAILRASYEIETWDEELGLDLADLAGFKTWPFFRKVSSGPELMLQALEEHLQEIFVPEQDFLLLLGGEHTLTKGTINFYRQAYPDLTVLQLDAHADLRFSYQGSAYSHACVMARVREMGLPLAQLGIRSLCREESQYIRQAQSRDLLTCFAWDLPAPEEAARKISSFVRGRPLYITFDADALDPAQLPGTGTPAPGGLDFFWLQRFWKHFLPDQNLVGLDFCELSPLPGAGVASESLAVQCINRILTVWSAAHE